MRLFIYFLLGVPIIILLVSIITCLYKKHNLLEWQYKSITILVVLLFVYTWIDSGLISRYVVKVGDKEYLISPRAFEEVISKNIDGLGLAISRIYEKYYQTEIFDCSEESETVKFVEEDGKAFIKLKLKYPPVKNTIQANYSFGFFHTPTLKKETEKSHYEDGFYRVYFYVKNKEELIKTAKEKKLVIEVKYFRKD